jgi:hypothetical protein
LGGQSGSDLALQCSPLLLVSSLVYKIC